MIESIMGFLRLLIRKLRERTRPDRGSRGLGAQAPSDQAPRSDPRRAIFHIKDTRTGVTSDIVTAAPAMEGWNGRVKGWSIGDMASAADVKIDEPLDGIALGVFSISNHIFLLGDVEPGRPLPAITCFVEGAWVSRLMPMTDDGRVHFRFDRNPLRIGRHEITLEVMYAGAEPAGAINALGLDLLACTAPLGNAIISPFSIQSALAMTYAGADGVTRDEMRRVLHYPEDETQLHADFAALRSALEDLTRESAERVEEEKQRGGAGDPITLTVANRLFAQQTYPFLPTFLELARQHCDAAPQSMDFAADPVGACRAINAWVEAHTQGRFHDLVPSVNAFARLVLVNAIYLKAPWNLEFSAHHTKPRPFHVDGGAGQQRSTMLRQGYFGYRKGVGYSAVTIPYSSWKLQLLLLVPDETDGLAAVEGSLTAAHLAQLAVAPDTKVSLYLPKFRLEPPMMALDNALMGLGMKTAFDSPLGSANFERMSPRHGDRYLFLAAIYHQTFFALDEEGTEAKAVTAVMFEDFFAAASVAKPDPIELKVDRPFLFAVQHRATGACLFLGRVSDPR